MSAAAPTAARPASPAPTDHRATGTWQVVRILLRRDRVKLPAWLFGLTVFVFYFNLALPRSPRPRRT